MIAAHEKWLANNWRESQRGGVYLKNSSMFVCVFPSKYEPGRWSFSSSFAGLPPRFSKETFDSIQSAQIGLFNQLYR